MALLLVQNARHPWVVVVLAACMLSGVVGLITPPNPRTPIDQYVTGWWRIGYYAALVVAGTIVAIGICLRNFRDRLMVEQIGLWFLSAPLLIYPLAIFAVFSGAFGLGSSFSVLVGAGGLLRIFFITRELKQWRSGASYFKSDEEPPR
jgi:hypothetical protein